MDQIQQLIEQAKAIMTCPSCGRHYGDDEISVKRFSDHTYIMQATCSREHQAVFSTWITSYAPTPTINQEMATIDTDHVIELHQALKDFDGNFKALWSKKGK